MKTINKLLTIIATGLISTSLYAIPVATNSFSVYDAAGNCTGGDHGLWTNTLNAGTSGCNDYYSFQTGSILTEYFDNDTNLRTAILTATALNPDNILATINIEFGDYTTTQAPVKNPFNVDTSGWYYYQSILASNINVDGNDYTVAMTGGYALQIGIGANDKSSDIFGGSVWVTPSGGNYSGGHWDLNMEFGAGTTTVPEPSIMLLLLSGMLGFAFTSRVRRS